MPKRATHEIAPRVRLAFLRALDLIGEREGKTFSELMVDAIDQHGLLVVMDRVSKFTERVASVNVSGSVSHSHERVSETAAWIEETLRGAEDGPPQELGEA